MYRRFWDWFMAFVVGLTGDNRAVAKPVSTVSLRVFRADGTVEDLGVVSKNGRPVKSRR